MSSLGRRAFLGGALAAAPALARRRIRAPADSRIEVLLDEPIGTIAPELYGHFTEHLGGVIYDGVWVGPDSRVPNIGGVRRDLVEALRRVHPSVIRWPGGCFADGYDWKDGVGPLTSRPRRPNFWADDPALRGLGNIPARVEPNTFGTTEFVRFCRLVGAQPYLAVNVRSLSARDFFAWLEYCNAPAGSTSWAGVRERSGDRDPYAVRFWGVGNEAWGCGGNFRPEEYAEEFRRFTTWAVPQYGVELSCIGSGPNGGDLDWTRRSFAALAERRALDRLWGWALHHYSSADGPGADAVAYDERGWYDLLAGADRMESLITAHWQVMREADRDHRVKLAVDEWGAWHKSAPLADPSHLFESPATMRDALVAGLTLDTFQRHADKVAMANVAQLVNCIQSLFYAHEDRFVVSPTYHVFELYAAHQGARAVRTVWSAPRHDWTDARTNALSLWGLNGSASLKERALTVTVANPSLDQPRETEIAVRGGTVAGARATTLSARDVHDAAGFDRPDPVTSATSDLPAGSGPLAFTFPPASVTRLDVTLA